ncbi:class I SAM-dependent methyltransferase [Dactylosporangium sp. AC04546]|uniref:class I SAM-dependent methyltransferase n=1 Tax=Dactylosporangium sp. AC04546 TaxID=2862460 RepID=UPI001EDE9EDA|nr:class I SAM-dependent methyltransferase [Dactylosporangium sp. AC04546]WVK87659.1 class I SAM-dependent methyltransferase [Dactylosporangium sp. AC04546]
MVASTPDGCPVGFYARLAPAGEPEIVHAAIPAGASVVELGCGTGRILRPLAALGHPVTGVDESPEMLAHAGDLDTVCARIQDLDLQRRFDAVLLASHLVNTPAPADRAALLAAARRHGGRLLVQWHPPGWFDAVEPFDVSRSGLRYRLHSIHRDGPLLTATMDYVAGDGAWHHTFTARRLTEAELRSSLCDAGFATADWLTGDRTWLAASAC